jgi:hypothetical protein
VSASISFAILVALIGALPASVATCLLEPESGWGGHVLRFAETSLFCAGIAMVALIVRTFGNRTSALMLLASWVALTLAVPTDPSTAPGSFLRGLAFPLSATARPSEESPRLELVARALCAEVGFDLALLTAFLALFLLTRGSRDADRHPQ